MNVRKLLYAFEVTLLEKWIIMMCLGKVQYVMLKLCFLEYV